MYQYKGYSIIVNAFGFGWVIYTPSGERIQGTFATDKEAEEYIDQLKEEA